jgi:hypothetical protein
VQNIYNISFGIDLYIWASLRYIELYHPATLLSSHCPVVVTYCENHRPELLPRLSPIISPIGAMAVYLKQRFNRKETLATISPCIGKSLERSSRLSNIEYDLTFAKLNQYLEETFPSGLPEGEADFDDFENTLGLSLTVDGGFMESADLFLSRNIRIASFSGPQIYELLDQYAVTDLPLLPKILDLANCFMGCRMGPGNVQNVSPFYIDAVFNLQKQRFQNKNIIERSHEFFQALDDTLKLETFFRHYNPSAIIQDYVAENRIDAAFLAMRKKSEDDKHVDCNACGSKTCLEMAKKVAIGVNIPSNCVISAQSALNAANQKFTDYLHLIHNIGEYMMATGSEDINSCIEHSLMAMCSALDVSRASIWRNSYNDNEKPECSLFISFPAMLHFFKNVITTENLPGWLEILSEGESLMKSSSEITVKEKQFFTGRATNTILSTPIMAQGEFWGFVMLVRRTNNPFNTEELAVIESSCLLLVSCLIAAEKDNQDQKLDLEPLSENSNEAALL